MKMFPDFATTRWSLAVFTIASVGGCSGPTGQDESCSAQVFKWQYPLQASYHWTDEKGSRVQSAPGRLWVASIPVREHDVLLQARWIDLEDPVFAEGWKLQKPKTEFHVLPLDTERSTWWSEDYDPDMRPREGIGWYLYTEETHEASDSTVVIPPGVLARSERIASLRRQLAQEELALTKDLKVVFATVHPVNAEADDGAK